MRQIALGIIITGLISTSAWADEPATHRLVTSGALAGVSFAAPVAAPAQVVEPEERPYTVSVGVDVPTDYYFRGYLQENEGFIAQPFVDLGFALSDTVSLNVGMWNSLHTGDATKTFYEADFYAALGFAAGNWAPGILYTAYTYPDDAFDTIHEVAFSIGYDDSAAAMALSPSAMVAVDLTNDGITYFELGVEPAIPTTGAVSLSVPVTVGMSLKDFYPETFGFLSAGVAAGADLGSGWEAHAGVDLLFLSDAIQFDDESVKPVFNVGFSYTY